MVVGGLFDLSRALTFHFGTKYDGFFKMNKVACVCACEGECEGDVVSEHLAEKYANSCN